MAYVGEVDIDVRASTTRVHGEVREIEYILFRTLSVMNRLGLPPEIDAAIQKIQKIIFLVRLMHSVLLYLSLSTPYGLALAAVTGAAGIISTVDLLNNMG